MSHDKWDNEFLHVFSGPVSTMYQTHLKRILRYVKGTIDYGVFTANVLVNLIGYNDNDLVRNINDSRSTSKMYLILEVVQYHGVRKKQ